MSLGGTLQRVEFDAGCLQPILDGTRKESLAERTYFMNLPGVHHRHIELAHFTDVRKYFVHGQQALRASIVPFQLAGTQLKEIFHVAQEEIVLVAIVNVEGGAAHTGAIEHVLHRDVVETFLLQESDESIAKHIACSHDASISLCGGVVGQVL